jgi:hypothetical protein
MTADRVLTVLAVVLAIPGFLLMFFDQRAVVGMLTVLVAFVLLAAAGVARYLVKLPEFSMQSVDLILEFQDDVGALAKLTKMYAIRPNFAHLREIIFRNNASDGSITDFRWNNEPIPADNIDQILGEYELRITSRIPYRRWKVFKGSLSYLAHDSFSKKTEALRGVVDFQTKRLAMEIRLPAKRPCKEARAFKIAGGQVALPDPEVQNGSIIRLAVKRPTPGVEYVCYWTW